MDMKDVVIIGGGIAGLSAAWWLRHYDIMLLEAERRIGGRICSERRGVYWLNWGGHVYAGGHSATARLLHSTGTLTTSIPGSLTSVAMNGKLLDRGSVKTVPFRIPMSKAGRWQIMKAGVKIGFALAKYVKAAAQRPGEDEESYQQRLYHFMNDCSFADFIGPLGEDAKALLEPTIMRSGADMHEISAGAGLGYFSLVWGIGNGLTNSIIGGPSTLTHTIAAALGDRGQLNSPVYEIVHKNHSVLVRYQQDDRAQEVEAKCVILATQADIAARIAVDLEAEICEALAKIVYGPIVSAAFLTNETGHHIWDNSYAIATPKRAFNILINISNIVRGYERERQSGSSLMVFSPASKARPLFEKDDAAICQTYINDLDAILPSLSQHLVEAKVRRWLRGGPYCFPGRAKLQQALNRRTGRIFLAGDYLGSFYTETAMATGQRAAQEARSLLRLENINYRVISEKCEAAFG